MKINNLIKSIKRKINDIKNGDKIGHEEYYGGVLDALCQVLVWIDEDEEYETDGYEEIVMWEYEND